MRAIIRCGAEIMLLYLRGCKREQVMDLSTDTPQHPYNGAPTYGEGGEWYLLREDIDIGENRCRAGTPVRRIAEGWAVQGLSVPVAVPLDGRVCRTEYGGLSLHVLSRHSNGCLAHRRIGSEDPLEEVPDSRVISPPECGHDRVFLAFGDQFYPLEYFGW
jgi:hypothetical protein